MAQTFFPVDPVDVTVVGAWVDIDVSAYVPAGATGVILHCYNTDNVSWAFGLRKKGSTDNDVTDMGPVNHCWAAIGVDANRIFQANLEDNTQHILLVGYTKAGVTFFTNSYTKSTGMAVGSWVEIDCSVEAPGAIGLIFQIYTTEVSRDFGLRKKGSTDSRINETTQHNCFGVIIGCDASQIVVGYRETTFTHLILVGYITDGAVFNTNATDLSLGSTGAWINLSALPAGSVMGFIEVVSSTPYLYGLRKEGSAEEIYHFANRHPWAFVQCDPGHLIEGKISNTGVDFFLVGYAITQDVHKDIATRFKLTVLNFKDIATRFRLNLGYYKDTATRFKLWVQGFKDTATRYKLTVRAYKDIANRFRLNLGYYKDIATRFLVEVQAYKDIATRFKIWVRGYEDTATRFELWVQACTDITSRFVLCVIKDASTRFALVVRGYLDTTTRLKLTARSFKDTAIRFKTWVQSYKDIPTRFILTVRGYWDIATRFRLNLGYYKDIATRHRLTAQAYKDVIARFRLGIHYYKDIATRFKATARAYKDIPIRFKVTVQAFKDINTRTKLIAQEFKDISARFLVTVQNYGDILSRFILHVQDNKDTATRFRVFVPVYKFLHWDINGAVITDNPYNLTMDSEKVVTPYFEHLVTGRIRSSPVGGGSDVGSGVHKGGIVTILATPK